jgi:sec-independent protein translocase protein TatB
MFDFAWSEIALIGVVALVLIGPKDLPIAIKTITAMVKKARRMAAEFQTHVDEMVKDADLGEVRDHIRDLRSLDIRGTIARAVDSDGSIRKAFTDPVRTPPPVVTTPVEANAEHTIAAPEPGAAWTPSVSEPTEAVVHAAAAPAFIPPEEAAAPAQLPPAFIPPEAVHAHSPQRA